MAYLNQVQEVNSHLSQAEARYQGAIHQQNQSHEAQLSQLRRELLQAQTKAEKATEELQKLKRDASRVHAEERDSSRRTLSTKPNSGKLTKSTSLKRRNLPYNYLSQSRTDL